jgi:hypothetical protein
MTLEKVLRALEDGPLPHNLNAERAILGTVLLNNSAIRALDMASPSHFFLPEHRVIAGRILSMSRAGAPIDLVTLEEELERRGELAPAGGAAYLAQLLDGAYRAANVEHYARIVREKAVLRQIAHAGEAAQLAAFERDAEPGVVAEHAEQLFRTLREQAVPNGHRSAVRIACWQDVPMLGSVPEGRTDWLVEGFLPRGCVALIAGEPGSYKTWLGLALGLSVATGGEFLGQLCVRADVVCLDWENPPWVIRERIGVLGIEPPENIRIWGGWADDAPPEIGDARLLRIARERKPLMILDSFVRFHHADENDATEMAGVMRRLRQLANAEATVVLLHHRAKCETSRYRGSSDILAGVDVAFSLSRDRDAGRVRLECFKSRFGEEFSLTLRPDLGGSGSFAVVEAPNVAAERGDAEKLAEVIRSKPGQVQGDVIAASGVPKGRARALLRKFAGKLWRFESGAHNAKRLFPVEASATVEIEV